jgi:hypothetical protein
MKKNRKSLNKKLLFAGMALLAADAAFAEVTSSAVDAEGQGFGALYETFSIWLSGNLGKLLALLGFAGTFLVYMMTHKGSVLFVGIIISLIAGGLIGIADTFFDAGSSAFGKGD